MSKSLKNSASMMDALMLASVLYMHLREPGNVDEVAERLYTLASEQQLPDYVAFASVFRGWAMAEQGRADEGIALIRAGLDSFVTLGVTLEDMPAYLKDLSEAQARASHLEEALATIRASLLRRWRSANPFVWFVVVARRVASEARR